MTVNRYGPRSREDRQAAIADGVMRHIVGAGRAAARREAAQGARIPVAPKVPVPPKPAQAAAQSAPAARSEPAEPRKGMKISQGVLDAAAKLHAPRRKRGTITAAMAGSTMFTPWEPPPGVLPADKTAADLVGEGAKMAMDYAGDGLVGGQFGSVGAWAGDALNVSFAEGIGFLGYSYLAALTQRAEYRRISERLASEMTRKWIRFHTVTEDEEYEAPGPEKEEPTPAGAPGVPADPEEAGAAVEAEQSEADKERVQQSIKRKKALDKAKRIKELEDEMRRLKVRDAFYTIAEGDGWFGRYHLYIDMGVDSASRDGRAELQTPIGNGRTATSKAKVNRKKPIRALRPIEPMWCYPAQYNSLDPLQADWYHPEQWYVNGVTVHRSRLLRFVGREVPDILKPAYAFGGLSMSQMAKPYVDNWLRTRQAVCDLIESFSVSGVYTNLSGVLEEGNTEAMKRIDMFNVMRSNAGAFVLDKETEEFFNISTPLGTLDALQAQSQEQMSSVSGIPLIVLLGITPKGLNASSEGELRAFYDTIQAEQERFFRDHLQTVIWFIMRSLWGEIDEEITFSFEPLWSMTEKERAETEKAKAETDGALIDKGIISPEEARLRVANDPQSPYQQLDPADVPEPPQQDMGEGGDDPFGGGGGDDDTGGGDDGGGSSGSEADKKIGDDRAFAFDEGQFNEDDHPRDDDGKFTSGGGGSKAPKPQEAKPKKTAGQTQHAGGQKLKMPQYGLTGTPWEKHQKPAGLPQSVGKPKDKGSIVVFKQGEQAPAIGGPKFKSVEAPDSWEGIAGDGIEEPELPKLNGRKLSAGVLIREPDGRVWMVRPTGGFGGYEQTFPKGRVSDGLSTQDSAVKEAWEETGLAVKLTGYAGDAWGDTTVTRFYYAERVGGDPADAGREAEAVILAPVDKLKDFLNRSRDQKIADHLAGKTKDVDADADDGEEPSSSEESSLSIDDLKKTGGKLGSNEGGQYEDAQGNKYYVKKPKTKEHVANEKAAARLYQLAGVQTLDYVDIGPDHVATKWDKLDKNNISKMTDAEKKAATADFMTHAWLSNWDAAGTGGDNQGVRNGKPVTLDVGGSLRYRAQGGPKGKAFGNKVSEIETMRDKSMSPDAARLYGKMSEDDLRASAERVTSIPDNAIREAAGDDELADTLIARKKDIAQRYGLIAQDGVHDDDAIMKAALDASGANLDDGDDGFELTDEEELDELEAPEADLATDASADGEHEVVIRADGDFPWAKLLAHLRRLGAIGASRTIEAYDEEDRPVKFGWDGDGADKIRSVMIDGQKMALDAALAYLDPEPTEVAPDVFAFDEANFDENKHPRAKDGKFAKTAGGGEGGKEGEEAEAGGEAGDMPVFKSKKEQIGHMLTKGTTPKELMQAMGWPSVSMPAQAASLGMKLEKKDGKYFGTKMTEEELAAFKADQAAKKAAKGAAEPPSAIEGTPLGETLKKAEALNKQQDTEEDKLKDGPAFDYDDFKSKMAQYVKDGDNDAAMALMKYHEGFAQKWNDEQLSGSKKDSETDLLMQQAKKAQPLATYQGQGDKAVKIFAHKDGFSVVTFDDKTGEPIAAELVGSQVTAKNKAFELLGAAHKPEGSDDPLKVDNYQDFVAKMDAAKKSNKELYLDLTTKYPHWAQSYAKGAATPASVKETTGMGEQLTGAKDYPKFLGAMAEISKSNEGNKAVAEKLKELFKNNPENLEKFKAVASKKVLADMEKAAPGIFDKEQPKPKAPEASEADKAKAKKSVPLQMQYVKANAKPETATYKAKAEQLLKEFNDKWTGKEGLSNEQLNEKVADFQKVGTDITKLAQEENKQKAEIMKAEQEKAAWEQKQAKEKEEKELAEAFAKNPELKLHHEAMEAMFGGGKESANYLAHAGKKVKSAGLSKTMTAHEAVPIVAYSGSHYAQLNSEIRKGVMTVAQYKFMKSLNAGLDKLPAYEGTTYRKAPSNAVDLSLYQPGKVVEERGFTSTSKNKGTWHGDVQYTVHGKTGRDIQSLSSHPGEAEVLFKSGTRFYVEKVEGKHITLREL